MMLVDVDEQDERTEVYTVVLADDPTTSTSPATTAATSSSTTSTWNASTTTPPRPLTVPPSTARAGPTATTESGALKPCATRFCTRQPPATPRTRTKTSNLSTTDRLPRRLVGLHRPKAPRKPQP